MDGRRVGRLFRAIREHQGKTQRELASELHISQSVISQVEQGRIDTVTVGMIDRIGAALGARLFLDARYRGGTGDRLIDRAHAALVEHVTRTLKGVGWEVELEFGFNVFGERGSVDILAWHAATRTLLIVEVKSVLTDLQAMLSSMGRKLRLVPSEVRKTRAWDPLAVGRVVVLSGTAANRSMVRRHTSIFEASFPAGTVDVRRWINAPSGPVAGMWFVPVSVVPTDRAIGRRRRAG